MNMGHDFLISQRYGYNEYPLTSPILPLRLNSKEITSRIFNLKGPSDFEDLALSIFRYQYEEVDFYRQYCQAIGIKLDHVNSIFEIPFLPIGFFKSQKILARNLNEQLCFLSSGTKSMSERSSHYVADLALYNQSHLTTFEMFVGKPSALFIFSMLPGYSDNPHSSLIYMVEEIANLSADKVLHRFPVNSKELAKSLLEKTKLGQPNVLFGVSFALIDFAEKFPMELPFTTIIETGGMKGKRKEITRIELHEFLSEKLKPGKLISEYGMTELLSQAYTSQGDLFSCPPWMKVLVRDNQDPLSIQDKGSGALNVIDLANVHSCSFIATDDLGNILDNGQFQVLGRFDHSDIRGCNLLFDDSI